MPDDLPLTLDKLGIGLSRLIRYSYGGVLLLLFAVLFHTDKMKDCIAAMTPLLTALTTVILGAGIYVFHRYTVISLFTWLLDRLFWLRGCYYPNAKSANPFEYLKSFVRGGYPTRRQAYTVLRHSGFFTNENALNINHAETGMLIMTSVALVLAAFYSRFFVMLYSSYFWVMLIAAILFIIAAICKDVVDLSLECLSMKGKENESTLASTLSRTGFDLTDEAQKLAANVNTVQESVHKAAP
jgi:hypothetical protein